MSLISLRLILASSSKPRQKLLSRLQIPFEIFEPHVDETALPSESPQSLVTRLAIAKAQKVASSLNDPNALIIGCDQVGILGKEILGKPGNYENAFRQLKDASGKSMRFYIGLCLFDTRSNTYETAVEIHEVLFRPLTDAMIQHYLQKEEPFQCAGACKAEGLGITLIERFSGSDYTALIGLPLIRLTRLLEHAGLSPV